MLRGLLALRVRSPVDDFDDLGSSGAEILDGGEG
jgi:hypothetical protein